MPNSKEGFAPIFVLLAASLVVLVTIPVLKMTVTTNAPDTPSVEGVLIAKGGDEGGGSSGGGGDSGSGSHDSGSSGGSSGGDNKPTTVSQPSLVQSSGERKEVERSKIKIEAKVEDTKKNETENEVEIEDEVESPEVEHVDIKLATAGALEVETEGTRSGKRKATSSGIVVANLKIRSGQDKIEIESKGVLAGTNFPLTFDKTTGQLFVNTPNGPRQIRVLPDQASEIAQAAGIQNQIDKIDLTQTNGSLAFEIKGKKTGSLLGLFPVSVDVDSKIDPATGQILSITQPRWLNLFPGLVK